MSKAQVLSLNIMLLPVLARILASDHTIAGLLLLFGLVTRLPFQSHILYSWDSVNFAYAIREFNIAKEQPQPPGYIIYVWLIQAVDAVVRDAQTTMVSLSILASALAAVALFYLGRALFDRRIGILAALFLATSPLFWFYGEIALPHTLDMLLLIVSVWWFYETQRGDYHYLYPAVAVVAIAGGVRQQTLVFLAPLILFSLLRVGWRRFIVAGLIGGVICATWFVPLIALSGGLKNYLNTMNAFADRFQATTSLLQGAGWFGIQRNVIKLTLYTLYGWGLPILTALGFAFVKIRRPKWSKPGQETLFSVWWAAPAVLFYIFIHMGQQGLVFVYLPVLLLISAVGLVRLLGSHLRWLNVATAALLAMNASIFCLAPEFPLGPHTQRLLTRATLTNSDHYFGDRFDVIRENFPPASTIILAGNWHHVEYYLPQYKRLAFNVGSKWEVDAGTATNTNLLLLAATPSELGLQLDANNQASVVIFDNVLLAFNQPSVQVKHLMLANDDALAYMVLRAGDQLILNADSYTFITK